MARVLLIGSHAIVTQYVVERLRRDGWEARGVVGAEAGMDALKGTTEVDAVVLGGPAVMRHLKAVMLCMKDTHPFAQLVIARSPEDISQDILEAMGGAFH